MPPKQASGAARGRPKATSKKPSKAAEPESSNPFESSDDQDAGPSRDVQMIEDEEPEAEKTIPKDLLTRVLHELFAKDATRISRDANSAVGKYFDVFVREAIARAAVEKEGGFLEQPGVAIRMKLKCQPNDEANSIDGTAFPDLSRFHLPAAGTKGKSTNGKMGSGECCLFEERHEALLRTHGLLGSWETAVLPRILVSARRGDLVATQTWMELVDGSNEMLSISDTSMNHEAMVSKTKRIRTLTVLGTSPWREGRIGWGPHHMREVHSAIHPTHRVNRPALWIDIKDGFSRAKQQDKRRTDTIALYCFRSMCKLGPQIRRLHFRSAL
ncbi:hypothetical protein G7046_g4947 [Stylonectria norvegica]|nr:hypothetical protein G7046_g4947 [Stylonectria norvegica]